VTATLDTELATDWVRRWDSQQEYYVADREERFAVIGDVVDAALAGTAGTVVDLGCGPGSLSARLAARLPGTRLIGLDTDPLLLALGRGRYGADVEFVDTDLNGTGWLAALPDVIDAAVSTTALHWLEPDALARVYQGLAARLRPGGVFVNGDHITVGDPALDELAVLVRHARAGRVGVADHEDWEGWWQAVGADPALSALLDERSARAVAHHGSNSLSVGQHADLLRSAGFRAAGAVWQCGDDQVLAAIR
jgi:SAM-dependent methyltransferase